MDETTFDPWNFSDPSMDVAPWADAGYQSDGTFVTPYTAQQTNVPAGTAGYSAPMSKQTYGLLSQGLGVLGSSINLAQVLDYKKYEATNGGLFMNGQGAYGRGQVVNPNYSMLILLMMGAIFMMKD